MNIFDPNEVIKRSLIHDRYGGSRQGGISPSGDYPYIFLFSKKSGEDHGYKDEWENSNVFSYTGEGQFNDMKFARGNLALRQHLLNQKRVFLFTEDKRSYVKFESEMELINIDFFLITENVKPRIAIKFFLKRIDAFVNYEIKNPLELSQIQIPTNTLSIRIPARTERISLITSRVGQGAYRKSILYRWEFKCAVTNYSEKNMLVASHIVPWKDSNDIERLDVNNGILLSPTYDALFDQQLISFENDGKIVLSEKLSGTNYIDIGVTGKERIKNITIDNHYYLEKHRFRLR